MSLHGPAGHDARAWLQALARAASAGVLAIDGRGLVVVANQKVCDLLGVESRPDDLVGTVAAPLLATAMRLGERGLVVCQDEPVALMGESGGRLWLLRAGAESLTEERLSQVRSFYEGVLDALPTQLAVFSPSGVYEYVTPSAIADPAVRRWIVGKTDREYGERRGLSEDVTGQRRQRILDTVESKVASQFDESFQTKTGELRHFRRYTMPVFDETGAVTHVLGYGLDLTDQRRAEEALLQAQKMDAIGRLAGGIAHDFNNLLTAINGFTQALQLQTADDDPRQELLVPVLSAVRKAADLTSHLLAFSRRDAVVPVSVNVNMVVAQTLTLLGRLMGGVVDVRVALSDEMLVVRAGPGRLEQVIMNLVVNARDAMPSGGTLSIETRRRDVTPESADAPFGLPPGSYVQLRVADTGIGMSDEVRARAFEPFFTTKAPGHGTGVGLATVYAVVTELGGRVTVDSLPGTGATFHVWLPALPAVAKEAGPADPPARLPEGTETILVAEDEPGVLRLVQNVLGQLGYRVLTATNGREALRVADAHDGVIDLVISDVAMPRMTGGELVAELRQVRPAIRVMFITGYAEDLLVRQALAHEHATLVSKPFDILDLARRVRVVLDA